MMGESGWSFVRSVHRFAEVDSTSDRARRMLEDGSLESPALVWADRQTRGRGQRSNGWWSDEGSLTATVAEGGAGTCKDEPIPGMLAAILGRLRSRLRELATDRARLAGRWNELDTLAGSRVRVEVGPGIVDGVARGIDDFWGFVNHR